MALSFTEKRAIQNEIQSCYDQLDNKPDFKTKRMLQNRLAEAYAKLEGATLKLKESLFDQLLAGKFLNYSVPRFFGVLKEIMTEVQNNIEPLKKPIIDFLDAHKSEMKFFNNGADA